MSNSLALKSLVSAISFKTNSYLLQDILLSTCNSNQSKITKKQKKAKVLKSVPSIHRQNFNTLKKKITKKNIDRINALTRKRQKEELKGVDETEVFEKNIDYFKQSSREKKNHKEIRAKVCILSIYSLN
jgi:hypothetical protein